MNNLECHYCGERLGEKDMECRQCGAYLGEMVKSRPFLCFLMAIGGSFALFTIWVGYNMFFTS
jgi:hypothetical protein